MTEAFFVAKEKKMRGEITSAFTFALINPNKHPIGKMTSTDGGIIDLRYELTKPINQLTVYII